MTYVIPVLLFATLGALAGLHAHWARGGVWPASDAEQLSWFVIGDPRQPRMPPPRAIGLVAGALAFAAIDALALGFQLGDPIDRLTTWTGAGLLAVFAVRGVVGYLPFWRAIHSGEAFTLLDKRFYSPLCILIAEGFFILVSGRL